MKSLRQLRKSMDTPKKAAKRVTAGLKSRKVKARVYQGSAKAIQAAAVSVLKTPAMMPRSSQKSTHAKIFWAYVVQQEQMTENDRIASIRDGLPVTLPAGLRDALDIKFSMVAKLLNTSTSTLERRIKTATPLDPVASERLDRIAQITCMAKDVLESREEAAKWLIRAHSALNQQIPISLCDTEIGARQVKRILSAIEWGNAA
jgi:putative toxin-antitoxin system antitoxin component (TIGR02293 family)